MQGTPYAQYSKYKNLRHAFQTIKRTEGERRGGGSCFFWGEWGEKDCQNINFVIFLSDIYGCCGAIGDKIIASFLI